MPSKLRCFLPDCTKVGKLLCGICNLFVCSEHTDKKNKGVCTECSMKYERKPKEAKTDAWSVRFPVGLASWIDFTIEVEGLFQNRSEFLRAAAFFWLQENHKFFKLGEDDNDAPTNGNPET